MFVVRDRIKVGLWRESFVKLVFLDHPSAEGQGRISVPQCLLPLPLNFRQLKKPQNHSYLAAVHPEMANACCFRKHNNMKSK